MATQAFGDMLYVPESDKLDEFPSPNDLRHKIILSTKPPKEYLAINNNKDDEAAAREEKYSSEDDVKVRLKANKNRYLK